MEFWWKSLTGQFIDLKALLEFVLNVAFSVLYGNVAQSIQIQQLLQKAYMVKLESKTLFFFLYLQNSMRATVELHEGKREGYPSIKTLVTLGKEDLSIKVNAWK